MKWGITVRPWEASGGSTVHDELIWVSGKTAREAIMSFYASAEYNFTVWRIIDVEKAERKSS